MQVEELLNLRNCKRTTSYQKKEKKYIYIYINKKNTKMISIDLFKWIVDKYQIYIDLKY